MSNFSLAPPFAYFGSWPTGAFVAFPAFLTFLFRAHFSLSKKGRPSNIHCRRSRSFFHKNSWSLAKPLIGQQTQMRHSPHPLPSPSFPSFLPFLPTDIFLRNCAKITVPPAIPAPGPFSSQISPKNDVFIVPILEMPQKLRHQSIFFPRFPLLKYRLGNSTRLSGACNSHSPPSPPFSPPIVPFCMFACRQITRGKGEGVVPYNRRAGRTGWPKNVRSASKFGVLLLMILLEESGEGGAQKLTHCARLVHFPFLLLLYNTPPSSLPPSLIGPINDGG